MVAEKKAITLVDQLAALRYYDARKIIAPSKKPVSFEDLPGDEQADYREPAKKFLSYLNLLNLKVAKIEDTAKVRMSEEQYKERLKVIIGDFIKGLSTTKPAFFPIEELALRILAG
jgi:hypothetical protein